MSNTVVSIFDDYKTEFSHHFNEVEIQSIDVFKAKSHLRVILSSYNPIVFEAQSDFALFLSQKYSDFSIEINNVFRYDSLKNEDIHTLIKMFSNTVRSVPYSFFEKSDMITEPNFITVTVDSGYGFLVGSGFESAFAEFIENCTQRAVTVRLDNKETITESSEKPVFKPQINTVRKKR